MKEKREIMPIEIFTALDLEMAQPSGAIIQIGAVVGNITTGEILEELCVNIKIDEQLTPFIIGLTGITQKDMESGMSLLEGYKLLEAVHLKHKSFCNALVWGGGDTHELIKQVKAQNPEVNTNIFGRRWIDVKTLFVSWRFANKQPIQGGLAKSMIKLGLKFSGRKHNSGSDALNTFIAYRAMLKMLTKDPEKT